MSSEADLQVFGNTEQYNFPLITVFGREPSNRMDRKHAIGKYADAAMHSKPWPSVDFWDKAYGLLGFYRGLAARQLKNQCIEKQASPIVITDLSPVAMDGSFTTHQKRKIRSAISDQDMADHIDTVLTHRTIFSRTSLVIFSGIESCGFQPSAVRYAEQACSAAGLTWCHIRSLSAQVTHESRRQQLASHKPTIESVISTFVDGDITTEYQQVA